MHDQNEDRADKGPSEVLPFVFKILIEIVFYVEVSAICKVAESEEHELYENVVVIDADAVHYHSAVMVIF